MATGAEVRTLLAGTTLPSPLVDDLIGGASPIWLMGESAEVIAGDLALCHPALAPEEVRATVHPTAGGVWRLSVVAADRSGLLARTASALTTHGLSVLRASVSTWPEHGLAVERLSVVGPGGDDEWDSVSADLRTVMAEPEVRAPMLAPLPPVKVVASPHSGGRTLVRVTAPDRVGLLWAVAAWFASNGCNIEVARVDTDGTTADDTFVVEGTVDAGALAAYLSGQAGEGDAPWVVRVGRDVLRAVGRLWPGSSG
jgi:glycine cleavage system regulatory protein